MIAFLALLYIAMLALLVKLGIIKLTIGWKLSPLLFVIVCMAVLIIPLQWGAPSGTVNVYQSVIEIIPNVAGEVIEIPARALEPINKGDVLFQIDPQPYLAEVERFEAALKAAEQNAEMLPADLTSAKAGVVQAEAALMDAKQQGLSLAAGLTATEATVAKHEAQRQLAQAKLDRVRELLEKNAASQQDLETEQRNVAAANATLSETQARSEQARLAADSKLGGVNTIVLQAEALLSAARAAESKAQLALDSTINGENTAVAQLRAQLKSARLNLDDATVRAPADGYLVGLSLRPGQRVANFPGRGWMTFVETNRNRVAVAIDQNSLRHVKPGQEAEMTFKLYPGRTISAKVESIAAITAAGQLQAAGVVPTAPGAQQQRLPFGVILAIDEDELDDSLLLGGSAGEAAIYTDSASFAHIIRRVELRMTAWLNYLLP